jgi:hypothetical protein
MESLSCQGDTASLGRGHPRSQSRVCAGLDEAGRHRGNLKRRLRALTLRLLTPKQPLLCVAAQRHELLIRVSLEALEVTR